VYGNTHYFNYNKMPALSGNCLKWKTDPIFWESYMHILMYNIYSPYFRYVILFFTYLSLFPSWFITATTCLNVYICPTLPRYNFTLWFLSSWVLITVLCTVCQTYVTLMYHGKIVLTLILAKQALMNLNGLNDETFTSVL
jgi:hypothetical protein